MPMTYIKVFVDWRRAIEPLSDAARGRLFTALLDYAETGKVPKMAGNERILFPVLRAQLDRDAASYGVRCEACRANGAYGGRPRKNPENQVGFSETKKTQDKDKEKDKEKEKDKDSSRGAAAPGERKSWRKKKPGPRADAPETVAADMKRMERFLLELRREAADQDRRPEEEQDASAL